MDKTPPKITIMGLSNGVTYNLGLVPVASFSAVDAISGVDTSSSTLTGGDTQGFGQFIYTVNATDKAGNMSTDKVTYTVNATASGTIVLINQLYAFGLIDQHTASTLSNVLEMAMEFYNNGNSIAGNNLVGKAFINQINAPGRNMSAVIATQLIAAATYIISNN